VGSLSPMQAEIQLARYGDLNLDGRVDFADLLIMAPALRPAERQLGPGKPDLRRLSCLQRSAAAGPELRQRRHDHGTCGDGCRRPTRLEWRRWVADTSSAGSARRV